MFKVGLSLLIVSMLLSDCSLMSRFNSQKMEEPPLTMHQQELERLNSHLALMRELMTYDYREQELLFGKLQEESTTLSTPDSTLRLALAFVTDGHPNTDIGRGYTELNAIAENPLGLSEPEINLVQILLENIEAIMIVEAQNAELTGVMSETQQKINRTGRSNRQSLARANTKLIDANLENETLRQQLQEALDKLDAIKNIEVSSE